MKILYVENMILGHHAPYIQTLSNTDLYDSVVLTPEIIPGVTNKQIVFPKMCFGSKSVFDYLECIKVIKETAAMEDVDIIHFLDGDKIMRYFGLAMNRLSNRWPIVITYHHLFRGLLRRISYCLMSDARFPVVHTDKFKKVINNYGIKNVTHIEYPSFLNTMKPKKKSEIKTIGMFGGTRIDKGLDILLKALEKVNGTYRLIIAGREADYKKADIEKMIHNIADKVTLDLRFLTEAELSAYWEQTDLVVLPYRGIFDGASGQLTEGVNRGLPIIGPSHGSLGKIITENHLGITFETENFEDLAEKIDYILQNGFEYDDIAKKYQDLMKPQRFFEDYLCLYKSLL